MSISCYLLFFCLSLSLLHACHARPLDANIDDKKLEKKFRISNHKVSQYLNRIFVCYKSSIIGLLGIFFLKFSWFYCRTRRLMSTRYQFCQRLISLLHCQLSLERQEETALERLVTWVIIMLRRA